MKTLGRIVLIAAIACAIYFFTIGNKQFYQIINLISDLIQTFADNYLKK